MKELICFYEDPTNIFDENSRTVTKGGGSGKTKTHPDSFQTEPPFEKGSDQEKMKIWEMKGPASANDKSF